MNKKSTPQKNWHEERRMQAWKLHEQGWKQKDIATGLGVTEGTVRQWRKKAKTQGDESAFYLLPMAVHTMPHAARRLSCVSHCPMTIGSRHRWYNPKREDLHAIPRPLVQRARCRPLPATPLTRDPRHLLPMEDSLLLVKELVLAVLVCFFVSWAQSTLSPELPLLSKKPAESYRAGPTKNFVG